MSDPKQIDDATMPSSDAVECVQVAQVALDPRHCGRPKADGTTCRAYKVRGKEACAGHLGLGIAGDPVASAALSAERRREQAQERKRTPREAFTRKLVENAEAYADRLHTIALTGDASESLRAIEQLTSRVLGKPKEHVEQVEVPADLAAIREMDEEQLTALWYQLSQSDAD